MRLLDVYTGLIAKAARSYGKPTTGQGNLFATPDFEQRKAHLHQEVRTDKRGRTSKRWVANATPEAPQAPAAPDGSLFSFDFRPPPAPKAEGTLFDFDFTPKAEAAPRVTARAKPPTAEAEVEDDPTPAERVTATPEGGQPAALVEYIRRLASPAKRAYAQAVANEVLLDGPPAEPGELDAVSASKVRRKVERYAGAAPAMTAPQATGRLRVAAKVAQADPSPAHEADLRGALKAVQVVTGAAQADDLPHVVPSGDTPAPAGQAYLVGLPEGVTDRQRRQWNDAAEALVMDLRNHPREATTEEKQLLARYSGNGGIGASLNEFYTPPELAQSLWQVLGKLGKDTGRGLEPSSGPGVMLQFAPQGAHVDAVELSPLSAGIASALFGHRHDVRSSSFEGFHAKHPDARYDFVIGNPPFGPRDEHALQDGDYTDVRECSRYFTLRALDHLADGGVAALVLPAGLARNKADRAFRERVLARAEILAIHALPTDTFERAGTDTATTDVWVVRARPEALRAMLDAGGEPALKAARLLDADGAAFVAGAWHAEHPEQLHATVTTRPGPMGVPIYARDGALTQGVLSAIVDATPVPDAPAHVTPEALIARMEEGGADASAVRGARLAQERGKEGQTRQGEHGQLQICLNGRWHNVQEQTSRALIVAQQLSDLLNLHAAQLASGQYAQANDMREGAERLLREYLAQHGNPHHSKDFMRLAREVPAVNALLAAIRQDGSLAPAYTEDAARREVVIDRADPASVAAALRRDGQPITVTTYRTRAGLATNEDAAHALTQGGFCYGGSGVWQPAGEYYVGESTELRERIERVLTDKDLPAWARTALTAQAAELERRVPRVPLEEFEVTPHDSWVPAKIVAHFMAEYVKDAVPGAFVFIQDVIDALSRDAQGQLGVRSHARGKDAKPFNFMKRYLGRVGRRADEAHLYQDFDEAFKAYVSNTPWMREAIEDAYAARGAWLEPTWDTTPVDQQIHGWRGRDAGGTTLHAYQNEAIHRALAQGGGVIALDVGLGKTPTALALGFYAKQQGLARCPVASVPKSVIGGWRQKALQVKPDARVLVVGATPKLTADGATELDDEGREVWEEVSGAAALDRQLSQLKAGDYDLVLMTHTTLARIQFDPMQQLELIQDEFYAQRQEGAGGEFTRASGMSGKLFEQYAGMKAQAMLAQGDLKLEDLARARARLQALDEDLKERFGGRGSLSDAEKKDKARKKEERQRLVFLATAQRALNKEDAHPLETKWSELPVDHLTIDEAHNFKALWTYSKGRGDGTVKYLGAPNEPAQRAIDLYYKSLALREQHGGRGVYLLTATPIKNSPVELYNMLSYTAPHVFKRLGIHNLDQFVERYCRIEPSVSVDEETGEEKVVDVLVGLKNLAELRREAGRAVNRKTAVQVGLPLPFNDEAFEHIEPKPEQAALIKQVLQDPVWAAREFLGVDVPEGLQPGDQEYDKLAQRYQLALPHVLRRAELDMEMIDPEAHQGYVSPKVEAFLKEVTERAAAGEKIVAFCDTVNMPNNGGKPNPNGYSFHEKLRRLVSERTGIPEEQIALVNADTTPDSEGRLAVSNGLKSGRYRMVIGNTGTMGEGINLQHGVQNLLHLDVPWNPAVWQQRVGRVVRQGNKSKSVNNKVFLGTRGLDKDMFDVLRGKGVWYDEFWNGESDTMDADGASDYRMTPERRAALLLDDPAEREAAMSAIQAREASARETGKRAQSLKTFLKLQSAAAALGAFDTFRSAQKDKPLTEKQQRTRDTLEATIAGYRDRLSKDPSFAPYAEHLDRPAGVVIDPASGKAFKPHQRFFATEDGKTVALSVGKTDPRRGSVMVSTFHPGGEGRTQPRSYAVADLARWDLTPYDDAEHVRHHARDSFALNAAHHKTREALAQHPEALRAGLRERAGRDPESVLLHVRRDGAVRPVRGDELRADDHILVPGDRADTEALNAHIEGLPDNRAAWNLLDDLDRQGFTRDHGRNSAHRNRIFVKAEGPTLSALYAGLVKGNA